MKKMLLLSAILIPLFSSCIDTPANTGKLVIQNNSDQKYTSITDIWTKNSIDDNWTSRWAGSIENGHEITIILDTGYYDIRIRTATPFFYGFFETPYKKPLLIKENNLHLLIFDGNGLY